MFIMDYMGYILTGVGGFTATYIVNNANLREGLTNRLLKALNKESINKIELDQHRVFLLIKTYKSQFSTFMFTSETKNAFYKEFLLIVLGEIEASLRRIIKLDEKGQKLDNLILEELSKCIENIEETTSARLMPPAGKVKEQFNKWKHSLLEAFKHSIDEITNDDLVKSPYFKVYRTLDTTRAFIGFLLNSGAMTFSAMNGAFDELKPSDVIKPLDKPVPSDSNS